MSQPAAVLPTSSPIVIIPARMASTRLPGKPLALIAGRPMILHVLARAMAAAIGPVAVACCDARVFDLVNSAGGFAVMTNPDLPSGSDRVHEALEEIDPARQHDIVVNLQGDLPSIPPEDLRAVLDPLDQPRFDLATLVAPITTPHEVASPSVVKAVCAFAPGMAVAQAHYFSRAAVPWGDGPLWHHVGVYAWRRRVLDRFVRLPPSLLEERERLEQLRALEAGMAIGCARIAAAPFGIDTPDDLARARAEMENVR
jgi:3-deoxy-manno-octulosonate cytidylyltransferase (CMP-KDO synthetase)